MYAAAQLSAALIKGVVMSHSAREYRSSRVTLPSDPICFIRTAGLVRVRLLTSMLLAAVIQIHLYVGECHSQVDEPQTPIATIRGQVTRIRDGAPITDGKIRVYRDTAVPAYWDLDIDEDGFYEGRFQSQVYYRIFATFGDGDERNPRIRTSPGSYQGRLDPDGAELDFGVTPGVVVTLNRQLGDPTIGGVKLYPEGTYAHTPPLPAFVAGSNTVVYYPDDHVDTYGEPLPFTGELTLYNLQPFCVAVPQNAGQRMLYDCSSTFIDIDTPKINFQSVEPADNVPAVYSWDAPGGIGYRYFPRTPDNRLPNNPNIRVVAEFGDALRYTASSTINKDFVRLNGVSASEDLTPQNNYTATFDFPIPDCGPIDLRIEYLVRTDGPQYQFHPLATHLATGASNADINADAVISLSDLPDLATDIGFCFGQSGFNPCSDLQPDNCVNTGDVAVFADVWYWQTKASEVQGIAGATARFVATERGSIECIVDAPETWTAGVLRFELDGCHPDDVTWMARSEFVDRSLLAPHLEDHGIVCDLFAFGPASPGATIIGEFTLADKAKSVRPRLVSTVLAQHPEDRRSMTLAGSAVARLGDVAPNPFNPTTVLHFELPVSQEVSLLIYDVSGRIVRTLMHGELRAAGMHEVTWDGADDAGRGVASGVYLYRLRGRGIDLAKRMTLLE